MIFLDWFKPSPKPSRPAGDLDVLAKQAEVWQALSYLPHFKDLADGGFVDLALGAFVTVNKYQDEPPYLVLTFSKSNKVLLSSVKGLEKYLAVQRAYAATLSPDPRNDRLIGEQPK